MHSRYPAFSTARFFNKERNFTSTTFDSTMRVVINSGFFSAICSGEYLNFIQRSFEYIVREQPDHEFIFLCERKNSLLFDYGTNASVYIVNRPVRNLLLGRYWYDIRLPLLLKKLKADLYLTAGIESSQTTKVPQCMIMPDMGYLQYPAFLTKMERLFYKRYTNKFLLKARTVIVLSACSKKNIIKRYKIADPKINIVFNAVDENFKPANEDTKNEIKSKYTGGRDYFLYSGAVHHSSNLINLLKAFSVFKKRQQTGMKLFICEKPGSSIRSIAQRLLTYKYRSDVVYLAGIDQNELARISASAYALVYPVYFDDFSSSVMEALHCNVPVLTSSDSAMAEVANDAALYADPSDYNAIAAQLMRLYKDENLRYELIKKGAVFSEQYRWQHTAEQLWQSVHRTTL